MAFFSSLRTAIAKRAAYSQLKFELSNIPNQTAEDLGLVKADAAKIAAKAIYG